MNSSRILHLDTLRLIACFLVVLTHSAMPTEDTSLGPYYAFISILSSPSSELFLALSGALLLPVKKETMTFYKQRFSKLIYPLLFWSLFAIAFNYGLGKSSMEESLLKLCFLPFKNCEGVYWFMYTLAGLYLFAPIISKWLISASKREIEFFLLLWGTSLTLPLINYIIPNSFSLSGSYYALLSPFGGFLGYMLLGYYCIKYPVLISSKVKTFALFFFAECCMFALCLAAKFFFDDYSIITDNLAILSACQVFLWISFITNINTLFHKIQRLITATTKYLFGVYLIHIFIIRDLVWLAFEHHRFNPILETLSICIISIGISLAIIWGLSHLPKSKFITGVA